MSNAVKHMKAVTTHCRIGQVRHRFRYEVDYVLFDLEAAIKGSGLFSRNRFNLASVFDRDHGGPIKAGKGVVWAKEILTEAGLEMSQLKLMLLTQPRFMGYGFNPVSFWLAMADGKLVAVIAEVSTTFGDRHSYLCNLPGFAPIKDNAKITKPKFLHVSPFQRVAGDYEFSFNVCSDQIAIRILHRNGDEGVVATLAGPLQPLTNLGLLKASLRRPLGALRTTVLIHWQALRLKLKGAPFATRPTPPTKEIS